MPKTMDSNVLDRIDPALWKTLGCETKGHQFKLAQAIVKLSEARKDTGRGAAAKAVRASGRSNERYSGDQDHPVSIINEWAQKHQRKVEWKYEDGIDDSGNFTCSCFVDDEEFSSS